MILVLDSLLLWVWRRAMALAQGVMARPTAVVSRGVATTHTSTSVRPLRPAPAAGTARVSFPARRAHTLVLRSCRPLQTPGRVTVVSDATRTDSAVLKTRATRCVAVGWRPSGNCPIPRGSQQPGSMHRDAVGLVHTRPAIRPRPSRSEPWLLQCA